MHLPTDRRREAAFSPTIELFGRKLRLSGQVDSKWGYKKFNNTLRHRCQGGASCRGLYDKSAPFEEQAAAVAVNQAGVFYGMFEDGAFTRFREASIAYTVPTRLARAVRANGREAWHLLGRDEGHGFAKKANQDYAFWTGLMFWQGNLLNASPTGRTTAAR